MKIERFECELLSKLIWLLLNRRIPAGRQVQMAEPAGVRETQNAVQCLEILQVRNPDFQKIRKALKNTDQMEKILIRSLEIAHRQFKLEKKKEKLSQNKAFMLLI